MSSSNVSSEHTCESLCFACKIKPGAQMCEHSCQDASETSGISIPVQIAGDPNDLKTDKLYDRIHRGEVSIHL